MIQQLDMAFPPTYMNASLRYFAPGEHHCTRMCDMNVLLMVFRGVLRFRENGTDYEVCEGEYFIQQAGCYQEGPTASDAPQYLYVHFMDMHTTENTGIPLRGRFPVQALWTDMTQMDEAARRGTQTEKLCAFYRLLCALYQTVRTGEKPVSEEMAQWLREHFVQPVRLEDISRHFGFSPNYCIRLFRAAFGKTPMAYLESLRLEHASYLLTATSLPIEEICEKCGFRDYSGFYRQFAKEYGTSPSGWRRQKQW